ncbi:MAG: sulfopyruvate decarboxylase subunit beta [Chlamydiae bacterium]|nr:sulfopyruvate decarboxylase subunit beta [Chlamydiota bacterium]MBI3277260.1 sulfopyruvate decarboxylase subunit beta [Chlamydiota bacterium]
MKRIEAIQHISNLLTDQLVIHANGHICRESFSVKDRPENFYMMGSMGLAPAIALGVALSHPERKVVVYDGDGSVLMSMGNLAMTGSLKPKNLIHIVFDNETYGSTGEQPTLSKFIPLEKIALDCGFRISEKVDWNESLTPKLNKVLKEEGPSFLLIKVQSSDGELCSRVKLTPEEITNRFRSLM